MNRLLKWGSLDYQFENRSLRRPLHDIAYLRPRWLPDGASKVASVTEHEEGGISQRLGLHNNGRIYPTSAHGNLEISNLS